MLEIGTEVSEQLDIVPMQIRVVRHIRKRYGCAHSEHAPVVAPTPALSSWLAWCMRAGGSWMRRRPGHMVAAVVPTKRWSTSGSSTKLSARRRR